MDAQLLHDINEISATLVQTPGKPGDLGSLLRHIAQTAQDAFATDACVIFAFNPITGGCIGSQTVVRNAEGKNEVLHEQPESDAVTQQVLRDGMVLVKDLDIKPQYQNRLTRKKAMRAFAGLALRTRHRKRPLGVIYLNFRQTQEFSSTDQERFHLFAVQASLLLQKTGSVRNYEEVARLGQKINHSLVTVGDLIQELQTFVDAVLDDSHTLLLAIYQPQTHTLDVHMKEQGHSTFLNTPLQGVYQHVIETQQSWCIEQLSTEAEDLPFRVMSLTGTEPKESFIFVPLTLRDESLGVLSMQHPLPKAYGREDLFVLQLLANYISLALHNMRLYSSLSQLNETGQLLTQQLESEQTLQATVDKIRDATKADVVVLFPYEPLPNRFVLPPRIAGTLLDPASFHLMSPSRPDDIAALTLRHEQTVFAKECATLYTELQGDVSIRQGNFQQREQIRSTAAVPLRVEDVAVGVLFVNFRQPQHFDATQKLFIEGLAHYAAIAIKNAQVFGRLSQRRVRELEILQNIDRELSRTLDLKSLLNTLLRLACEQVFAEEAAILLYNPRIQALEIPAASGPHAEARQEHIVPLQETKGITRWALEHKKPARVDNVLRDPQWRDLYMPAVADTVSELDVPLLDGEEVIGVLNFESMKEGAFRQEDEDFLLALAGQAVLAIKNAKAYEREKRLAEEGRVLNEISKEIISQLDLARVFHLIIEKALELTQSTLGSLHLYDPDLNELYMVAERGVAPDKKGARQGLYQGIVGYVAGNKQLLNVNDVSDPPWNEVYLEFFPGACSELAVPMLAGNELRGVLNVESPNPNNFGESDERLLQGLADLAVVALQNAQAYEREKRLAAEAQVLNEISKEITSQLDPVHAFDLILEKALELTHSNLCSLMLYNPDQNDLHMVAERGVAEDKKGKRQGLHQGIVGYVARNKRFVNVDVSQPPWKEIYVEFTAGMRSELAVPMLAGNELRGVLNVESFAPNNFGESDERLLQGLADLAVVALQNAERYEEARREAQRFALLYRAGQELGKITSLTQIEQAYDTVLQIAEEQSQGLVVIRRYDQDTQELVVMWTSQPEYAPLFPRKKIDTGVNGQVARERRTIVLDDTDHPPPGVASPKVSDPTTRSLLITPIMFKEQYYGNLGLSHQDIGHFQDADKLFFEGLAQQLASTIYRLETVQERQEFEERAIAAEVMGLIGQTAFELTHRWDSDLGLFVSYVNDIRSELETLEVTSQFIAKKLDYIVRDTRKVLDLSKGVKQVLARSGEAIIGESVVIEPLVIAGEPEVIHPRILLEEAQDIPSLPATIRIDLEIDEDVAAVRVIHHLVADILRNLMANAIEAMPGGGKITLRARNAGRFVALEVTDTGVGIPQQDLGKIFGLFYSTKGSSGFGLWSARCNALRNHGDLKVKSEPGQGTTFTLSLPRVEGTQYDTSW